MSQNKRNSLSSTGVEVADEGEGKPSKLARPKREKQASSTTELKRRKKIVE